MSTEEVLLIFSQIALGLAGFSAILIALSGSPHQWRPIDSYRIKNILSFGFQAIFISLVPVALKMFSIQEWLQWRASLLVLAIGTFGGVALGFVGYLRLSQPERRVVRPPLVYSIYASMTAMAMLEAGFAFRNPSESPGVFFVGLIALLAMTSYLIIRFLFARPAG